MRIGIDVDDTITNSWECMIPHYAKRFNVDEKILAKSKPYYNSVSHLISLDDYYKIMLPIYDKYIPEVTLKDNAKEVINELHSQGHEIYIITARGIDYTDSYKTTKDYLDKHGIKYDRIITRVRNKADICVQEKIDFLIDDSPKHCMKAKESGIDVIMFDTYYNREYKEFKRIKKWEEVFKYIKDR